MKLPISVFIITRNEEARIGRTIEAVREWVAEVVVADSGSTDGTVKLARSLGAKTYHKDWEGYGAQKRFAEDQCSQDWWFNLDADEVVTPAFRKEVEALFADGDPAPSAFKVKIHYVYPGDDKPRPWADDYNVERLYHKSVGRYRDHPVFDRVVLEEGTRVLQLNNPISHFAIESWQHMLEKTNASSSHNLEKLVRKPSWILKLRLVTGFPLNFLRNYIFRRHIFGGTKGFVFSLNTAFSRTMRIAKALELKARDKKD